jgi:hypothetical protein
MISFFTTYIAMNVNVLFKFKYVNLSLTLWKHNPWHFCKHQETFFTWSSEPR